MSNLLHWAPGPPRAQPATIFQACCALVVVISSRAETLDTVPFSTDTIRHSQRRLTWTENRQQQLYRSSHQSKVCSITTEECDIHSAYVTWSVGDAFMNRLFGLVVRCPPRERKIPGSNPACTGIFSGLSHTSDLNIGTPVATLPGAWRYRVSSWIGRPGVSIL